MPLLCVWFLPSERQADEKEGLIARLTASYSRWLGWILQRPIQVLAAAGLLFAISIVALGRVPTGLLPPSDRAQFVVRLELPAGASESETLRVTERVARWAADERANADITSACSMSAPADHDSFSL